jgi:hypothetical protein
MRLLLTTGKIINKSFLWPVLRSTTHAILSLDGEWGL